MFLAGIFNTDHWLMGCFQVSTIDQYVTRFIHTVCLYDRFRCRLFDSIGGNQECHDFGS